MFVVTNRDVDESDHTLDAFKKHPNRLGPNELRLAEVKRKGGGWHVDVLPDKISKKMAKEVGLDPTAGDIFASRYVARVLYRRVNPSATGGRGRGRNLVFFVHGFNNDMRAVIRRAAALEALYGVEVLAFSWPANGGGAVGVASYLADKRDALASTGALDRCLGRLREYVDELHKEYLANLESRADDRFADDAERWDRYVSAHAERACPFKISMVLHSMGNYVFKHLLSSSSYRGNLLLFDNVVMVAADTNNEEHRAWVERIEARGRVYITLNERDAALKASRMKLGEQQKARLGHYPYRLDAQNAVYVDFTDTPRVGTSHAYFEGDPVKNARVHRFFETALNGDVAENGLTFDASRNLHLL